MIEIGRIEETSGMNEIEMLRARNVLRKCLYFKEEICCAPKMRFEACRSCIRINTRAAVKTLFDRIKGLAGKLFNFQETELG